MHDLLCTRGACHPPTRFFFRLLLQPVLLWQAWWCATNVDISEWLAQSLGLQNSDSTKLWNFPFVMGMFCLGLRSFEWTFVIKEPLRRYELTTDQGAPTGSKKPLSISSVLLDGLDLFFNQRGLDGRGHHSHSPNGQLRPLPSPPFSPRFFSESPCSTPHCISYSFAPAVTSSPNGGSIFDPNLSVLPRIASAAFASICGGFWTYLLLDMVYNMTALIGRVVCRQPGSHWPPISHRPWLSTSLHEFWSYRWHQLFRHTFVTFGARPGGALLGRPGALIGAFAVSGVMHFTTGVWGLGNGAEFGTAGGFFLLMGLGVAMEVGFRKVTGMRVGGFFWLLWTMFVGPRVWRTYDRHVGSARHAGERNVPDSNSPREATRRCRRWSIKRNGESMGCGLGETE
ncbi:hypothetical protein EDB84DRAFT_211478 [Lactarius hengduanensis]|nr:hypothetical protein EDB84DRAFT_211478 [Lactarius hengduanensis]